MSKPQTPPDAGAAWDGAWDCVDGPDQLWLLAAVNRTVAALPALHPWRLGDDRATGRVLQWTALADGELPRPVFAVLAMTQRDPDLAVGGDDISDADWALARLTGQTGGLLLRSAWEAAASVVDDQSRQLKGPPPRWVGVLTRLPGAWLPPLAILPSSLAGMDDPGTGWSTESIDFDAAHRVHAADREFAANVLAPHVMALIHDAIPADAALTAVGDALHVWWPYRKPYDNEPGRTWRGVKALADLAAAIPGFVLDDYPDRSAEVQGDLDEKAAAAEQYRATRKFGQSTDPVLQRIYDQARHVKP